MRIRDAHHIVIGLLAIIIVAPFAAVGWAWRRRRKIFNPGEPR